MKVFWMVLDESTRQRYRYANGSHGDITAYIPAAANQAVAGYVGYENGAFKANIPVLTEGWSTSPLAIAGLSQSTSVSYLCQVHIQAFAIYDCTLTADQVAKVEEAMANLSTASSLDASEKIFAGGYKWTNTFANQGIYQDLTVSAGDDFVIRGLAHSDGTSVPKLVFYDQTNGVEIGSLTGQNTTGTHDGGNDQDILTDSGEAWVTDDLIGFTIKNETDGSSGTITDNSSTTITAVLTGGTDNNWDDGDTFRVFSSRARPDVFIFTGEAPTDCTNIRVKLINTESSGTVYWHQVEVLDNIVNNPSMERCEDTCNPSDNPWVPSGWRNIFMEIDDGVIETSTTRTGSRAIKFTNAHAGEGIGVTAGNAVGAYFAHGAWGYGSGSVGPQIGESGSVEATYQYALATQPRLTITTGASWNHKAYVARAITADPDMYVAGNSATLYADDMYIFHLDDVNLTVTPADETNSTENTDEIRVDGRDTYVESGVVSLGTTSGYMSFDYRPRHSAAAACFFAENTNDDAYIFSLTDSDNSDFINLYWDSANTVKLAVDTGSGEITDTWDATGLIAADTQYAVILQYTSGGNIIVSFDNTERLSVSMADDFDEAPDDAYFGSDYSGGNQGDATFSELVFDNTPPSISLIALSPDPHNDNTPDVTGTATEAIGTVSTVEYQIDGTGGSWTACSADDGAFNEATETFACPVSPVLTDGSHTIYVRATDSNGNTTGSGSESSDTFTIDATNPTVSLTVYSPDPTTDNTPSLTGTAADAITTLTVIEYQVDSTSGSWTTCLANDGVIDETTEAFTCVISALIDGSHTIYVRAEDSATNYSSNASDVLTVDTTNPASFSLLSPGNDHYTNVSAPEFEFSPSTDTTSGLASYTFSLSNYQGGSFSFTGIPADGGDDDYYEHDDYEVWYRNWTDPDLADRRIKLRIKGSYIRTVNLSGVFVQIWPLEEGQHSWSITAKDNLGQETTKSHLLNVDKTGPGLSETAVHFDDTRGYLLNNNDSYQTAFASWAFSGKITDNYEPISQTNQTNSGPSKIELELKKKTLSLGYVEFWSIYLTKSTDTLLEQQASTSEKTARFYLPLDQALPIGEYQVILTAKDNAGNSSSQTYYLNLKTVEEMAREIVKKEIEEGKITQEEEESRLQEVIQQLQQHPTLLPEGEKPVSFLFRFFSASSELSKQLQKSFFSALMRYTVFAQSQAQILQNQTYTFLADYVAFIRTQARSAMLLASQFDLPQITLPQIRLPKLALNLLQLSLPQIELPQIAFRLPMVRSWLANNGSVLISAFNAMPEKLVAINQQVKLSFNNLTVDARRFYLKTRNKVELTYVIWFVDEQTQIFNLAVKERGIDYVIITWQTNHPASSKVSFGTSLDYGRDIQSADLVKSHEIKITNLEPGTDYFYEVMSQGKTYVYDAAHSFKTEK